MKPIIQRMNKNSADEYIVAEKYYSILATVNGIHLTQRDIQLVAYTAIRGNMTSPAIKEDFCKKYNTTAPTINNMISKLKRVKIIVKEKGIIKVNPVIGLDFKRPIVLEINLTNDNVSNG